MIGRARVHGLAAGTGTLFAIACGSTTGPVLERVAPAEPPASTLRADVFLVRSVTSCAIGGPCTASDPSACFSLSGPRGPVRLFRAEGLDFVPPGDPRIAAAPQSGCFHLGIDDATAQQLKDSFELLRARVFQLSQGSIDLEVRVHDTDSIDAGFKRWEGQTGIFLQPSALAEVGLPMVSRDTDFVYAVTGASDPDGGPLPKIQSCAGTNWEQQGGFGGSAYTWASAPCARPETLLAHLQIQAQFALRDFDSFVNRYADGYPPCGQGDPDPSSWFPWVGDCASDPDAPTCGTRCSFGDAYASHVLTAHWPKGGSFVGNHCRNGVVDWDESDVDQGGVCDQIGR